MKIFQKEKLPNGKRKIYILGKLSFCYKKKLSKYNEIYSKRYDGLSESDLRYCLEKQFINNLGYPLNLDNPQTFNEKLQWLKLYYRNPLMTKCADKVGLREYIKKQIGEEYLIPIIGIYNTVDEIDWENLPERFVAKVNWGSGQNIIVKDKLQLDIDDAKLKLKEWMQPQSNHYYHFFEWGYKNISPKIIIEEYIEQNGKPVQDYKWFCFNGSPKILSITKDSFDYDIMQINYYDENYKLLPYKNPYPNIEEDVEKPKFYNKMVKISKAVSKEFPMVRIDFYDTGNKLYIGELTFYPGAGIDKFYPQEWDRKLGDLLKLPEKTPFNQNY